MFIESLPQPANQHRDILRKFDLFYVDDNRNWDENVFLESYFDLKKELENSPDKDFKLRDFYADAFLRKPHQEYTDYEDRFSMPPIGVSKNYGDEVGERGLENSSEVIVGHSFDLSQSHLKNFTMDIWRPLKAIQYGPSRLYNLKPQRFTFIPYEFFSEEDILGSDAFTACSAIIVKGEKGIFYAHVATPNNVLAARDMLEYLRENWQGKKQIYLVRPQWSKKGEMVEDYEQLWKQLEAEFPEVSVGNYSYIAHESDRPNKISDSSILVTRNKIMIVGRKLYPTEDYDRYSEIKSAFDNTTTKYISIDDENK